MQVDGKASLRPNKSSSLLPKPDEILISGKVAEVADDIERVRKAARVANGWIMDTYLLRKP